jgi:hypothetical protein
MNPATPEKKPKKPGPSPLSALKQKLTILTTMTPPIRGGEHKTHGIYIEGGKIRDDWKYPEIIAIHHSDATKSMLPRLKGISLNGAITAIRGSSKGPYKMALLRN